MALTALGQLDPRVIGLGVLRALLIVAPVAGLSIVVVGADDEGGSGLGLLLIALLLVGFGLGGRRAARTGVDLPMTHGAFVGLVTFALVQAVILTGSAIIGREGDISIVSLAFSALMASGAGMIGAMLGIRRAEWYR
jgi:hypothetical protein